MGELLSEKKQLIKWVGMFQLGSFWMGIFPWGNSPRIRSVIAPHAVIRYYSCHLLSFVVTPCHLLYHSLSLVFTRCNFRLPFSKLSEFFCEFCKIFKSAFFTERFRITAFDEITKIRKPFNLFVFLL